MQKMNTSSVKTPLQKKHFSISPFHTPSFLTENIKTPHSGGISLIHTGFSDESSPINEDSDPIIKRLSPFIRSSRDTQILDTPSEDKPNTTFTGSLDSSLYKRSLQQVESFSNLCDAKDDVIQRLRQELTKLLKFKKETTEQSINLSLLQEQHRVKEVEYVNQIRSQDEKLSVLRKSESVLRKQFFECDAQRLEIAKNCNVKINDFSSKIIQARNEKMNFSREFEFLKEENTSLRKNLKLNESNFCQSKIDIEENISKIQDELESYKKKYEKSVSTARKNDGKMKKLISKNEKLRSELDAEVREVRSENTNLKAQNDRLKEKLRNEKKKSENFNSLVHTECENLAKLLKQSEFHSLTEGIEFLKQALDLKDLESTDRLTEVTNLRKKLRTKAVELEHLKREKENLLQVIDDEKDLHLFDSICETFIELTKGGNPALVSFESFIPKDINALQFQKLAKEIKRIIKENSELNSNLQSTRNNLNQLQRETLVRLESSEKAESSFSKTLQQLESLIVSSRYGLAINVNSSEPRSIILAMENFFCDYENIRRERNSLRTQIETLECSLRSTKNALKALKEHISTEQFEKKQMSKLQKNQLEAVQKMNEQSTETLSSKQKQQLQILQDDLLESRTEMKCLTEKLREHVSNSKKMSQKIEREQLEFESKLDVLKSEKENFLSAINILLRAYISSKLVIKDLVFQKKLLSKEMGGLVVVKSTIEKLTHAIYGTTIPTQKKPSLKSVAHMIIATSKLRKIVAKGLRRKLSSNEALRWQKINELPTLRTNSFEESSCSLEKMENILQSTEIQAELSSSILPPIYGLSLSTDCLTDLKDLRRKIVNLVQQSEISKKQVIEVRKANKEYEDRFEWVSCECEKLMSERTNLELKKQKLEQKIYELHDDLTNAVPMEKFKELKDVLDIMREHVDFEKNEKEKINKSFEFLRGELRKTCEIQHRMKESLAQKLVLQVKELNMLREDNKMKIEVASRLELKMKKAEQERLKALIQLRSVESKLDEKELDYLKVNRNMQQCLVANKKMNEMIDSLETDLQIQNRKIKKTFIKF